MPFDLIPSLVTIPLFATRWPFPSLYRVERYVNPISRWYVSSSATSNRKPNLGIVLLIRVKSTTAKYHNKKYDLKFPPFERKRMKKFP